jgi:hypothetical protein
MDHVVRLAGKEESHRTAECAQNGVQRDEQVGIPIRQRLA